MIQKKPQNDLFCLKNEEKKHFSAEKFGGIKKRNVLIDPPFSPGPCGETVMGHDCSSRSKSTGTGPTRGKQLAETATRRNSGEG